MLFVTIMLPFMVYTLKGLSITGATVLNTADRLSTPCTSAQIQPWTFAVYPAPFAEPSLTNATVARSIQQLQTVFAIQGGASENWFDVSLRASRRWPITSIFDVGTIADVGASRAAGFSANIRAALGIQSRIIVDTHWTVGVGISNALSTPITGRNLPRQLRFGVAYQDGYAIAFDVVAQSANRAAIEISALVRPHESVGVRTRIVSDPLSFGADVRLASSSDLYISVMYDLLVDIGHRLGIVLELG
ncbi:MAG: hypothetical protein HYX66_03905 [Ignavibacteria bacterium]|nr:hypothetical protein [Ignavibacteria bacterium]